MPKKITITTPPPQGNSTIKSARAFMVNGKKRYGREITVLAAGETETVPAGQRVEVILMRKNKIFFTESDLTLTGPLVFWQEEGANISPGERFKMRLDDVESGVGVLTIFMSVIAVIMLAVAIISESASTSLVGLFVSAVSAAAVFGVYKSAVSSGKADVKLTEPTRQFADSLPGVSMDDFYPRKPALTNIE